MHTLQPSLGTDRTPRTTSTIPTPAPMASTQPTLEIDTENYQSAKGCLQLSVMILACLVVCAVAGVAINAYINATTGG